METSKKYKEIFRLKKMLEDANIPFDFFEMDPDARKIIPEFEHWHINYPNRGDFIVSAIEGFGTYGEQDDKLEIMGGLTEEEKEEGYDVIGWLTAEEVFERIYNKVLSKLPEEIEVNNIPDILKPKPLTDLFLEVLGEIEVGEDNTFNNKTDGYGTDEVIVPEKKKEAEEPQVNSDL